MLYFFNRPAVSICCEYTTCTSGAVALMLLQSFSAILPEVAERNLADIGGVLPQYFYIKVKVSRDF
jgi:hypothetical protein